MVTSQMTFVLPSIPHRPFFGSLMVKFHPNSCSQRRGGYWFLFITNVVGNGVNSQYVESNSDVILQVAVIGEQSKTVSSSVIVPWK